MQTASSVSRRCTNHVECTFFNLSSCLLSPLFLFLFQTSPRHLGKMCSPRTPSTSFVYTRLRIRNAPSRIDTQTSLFLSLSLSFCSLARVAFATIGSIAAIGASFLSGTVAAINDRARRCLLPSIPERYSIFFSSTGNAIEPINDVIIRVLPRVHSLFERC